MSNHLTEIKVLLSNRNNLCDDLSSAAALAKTLKVSLKGIYLEEEDLICASELSISSDISRWSAKEKEISKETVQQALRNHARHQKQQLKKIAEQENIDFGFDVVRGERTSWILEDIKSNDILFVAHQKLSRNIFHDLNYSCLNEKASVKNPVKIVFSGSNASIKAFEIALQIGLQSQTSVTVLLDADTFENEVKLREQLNFYLEKHVEKHKHIKVDTELLNSQNQAALLSRELYMLVYPVEINDKNEFQLLHQLIQHLHSPLVLVR